MKLPRPQAVRMAICGHSDCNDIPSNVTPRRASFSGAFERLHRLCRHGCPSFGGYGAFPVTAEFFDLLALGRIRHALRATLLTQV
jgi:hypothetical protein